MPTFSVDDSIVAVATPHLGGVRGIVRLSGNDLRTVLRPWLGGDLVATGAAYRSTGMFGLPEPLGAVPVDIYHWPDSRSYTGQPMVELHTTGSLPVLEAIHAACCRSGARPAERGEFTLRAFLAGKLDLTQAEAVYEIIHAGEARALESALQRLAGGLSHPLQELRQRLLSLLAELEAGLDFVEEDIEFVSLSHVVRVCREARRMIAGLLDQIESRGAAGDVPLVVFVGRANAGKSSLINALAERAVALVSPSAGTTRDPVTATVTWRERTLVLADTAGEQDTDAGSLEAAGLGIGREFVQGAAVVVRCVDVTCCDEEAAHASGEHEIRVWTKCDLARPAEGCGSLATSSATGEGLDALRDAILQRLDTTDANRPVPAASVRCRAHLEGAHAALASAEEVGEETADEVLVATELRTALDHIGRLVGAVYTDDLLDEIFGRFCIGK